jgi:hypothetical protein
MRRSLLVSRVRVNENREMSENREGITQMSGIWRRLAVRICEVEVAAVRGGWRWEQLQVR